MTSASPDITLQNIQPDSVLRRLIGYNLKRAYHEIQAQLSRALAELDLKIGSYAALSVIVNMPGLKQSALAETLAIEQANLVQLLDRLEARQLIKRERTQSDRRAYALFATPQGRKLCTEADERASRLEENFLRGLSAEDISTLFRLLQHIETSVTKRKA